MVPRMTGPNFYLVDQVKCPTLGARVGESLA